MNRRQRKSRRQGQMRAAGQSTSQMSPIGAIVSLLATCIVIVLLLIWTSSPGFVPQVEQFLYWLLATATGQ